MTRTADKMQTLIDLFETFEALGDKTAFVNRTGVRRIKVSYREFHDLSLKMANLLAQNGVTPGDRVLIWGPNSSWWAVAYWGIIIRGAIAVPVDFMSDLARAESIRGHTRAKVVLQSRFKPERMTAATSLLLEDLLAPFGLQIADLGFKPGNLVESACSSVTNFHLPESTLLTLVCAFAGIETILRAYKAAISNNYRFYSYGDVGLII